MGTLNIDILGTSFTAQAPESDEYLNKLTTYYSNITSAIEKNTSLNDPLKISILAGISIIDELLKEKKQKIKFHINSNEETQAEEITKNLINSIDNILEESNENIR